MSVQRVSSFVPAFSCWRYDVFLSFRGEDTRNNFTSHFYTALNQRGIRVFRDDNELERGKSISPELLRAIEESRCSVIVFSRNYAHSTWCLEELVKIVECKNKSGIDKQIVFPIFYDVEPTVVRKQTGDFQEDFAKHEEAFAENIEKVQKWRDALKEVANISGWELKDKNESEFMEDIAKEISSKLIPTKFETQKELVGINSRLEELLMLLDPDSDGVRIIGIWGMGGLGKTTIARVVYDLISCEYEGISFLADVRETCKKEGLISLQKQLLSDLLKLTNSSIWNVYEAINIIGSRLRQKKVLLVVDDVVDVWQLESLAKREWFGSGNRIIITSRDKHLLMTHGVDQVYMPKGLNDDEALRLFCLKASKTHQPLKEYLDLSKRAVEYAAGLPLAVRVLGSFLFGRTVEEWESALQRLKGDSTNQIKQILEISFDGLQETEKNIFLDIACFFKGWDRDKVIKILEGCGFDPVIGISVLIEKSLISSLAHNRVGMHDLLEEMGQQIVKRISEDPGKRSRLWEEADVRRVLSENLGTEEIEGIVLNYPEDKAHTRANAKDFSKMTNLRLLKIGYVELPEGLEYLSNKLRLLEWHGYPLELLPSNLQLDKIVELNMRYSNIKPMLTITKPLNNLKLMRFSHSQNLIRTPDFTGIPNLEELDLEGCTRLCEIHSSLLLHKKLIFLSLKDCRSLTNLPGKIHMESLKKLELSGCLNLRKFPEITGRMKHLSQLLLDGTAIKELSLPVNLISGLVLLNLKDCKKLKCLPSAIINGLKRLETLNLSGCSKLRKFPEIEGKMECLSKLSLDGTAIEELPSSVELLCGLVFLNLEYCKNLRRIPSTISGLKYLKTLNLYSCTKLENVPESLGQVESLQQLDISGTAIRQPVLSIFHLENLKVLSFRGCKGSPASTSTSWFSRFPINLMPRRSSVSMTLALPSLSGLTSLTKLDLSDCNLREGAIPSDICNLLSLEKLNLSRNNFVSLPGTINRLSKLTFLQLEDCMRLESLPELPSKTMWIVLNGCALLERLSDAFELCKSEWLFVKCLKLVGISDSVFSMLKMLLESNLRAKVCIVVPGREIPEWFRYQNEGSSLTIIAPPDSHNNKIKFVGYAICCVFHVHRHPPTLRSSDFDRTYLLTCMADADESDDRLLNLHVLHFVEPFGQPVSDHLWLLYLSNEIVGISHPNRVGFSFAPYFTSRPGLEVKRCGVHPVYVDVEEFYKTTKEGTKSIVWNFNESDDQFCVGSKMDVATMSKRGLTEYARAELSASGEGV